MLPPRTQVAFLRDALGGFAVVGFQEVDGILPFGEPEFGLGHNSLNNNIKAYQSGADCNIIMHNVQKSRV